MKWKIVEDHYIFNLVMVMNVILHLFEFKSWLLLILKWVSEYILPCPLLQWNGQMGLQRNCYNKLWFSLSFLFSIWKERNMKNWDERNREQLLEFHPFILRIIIFFQYCWLIFQTLGTPFYLFLYFLCEKVVNLQIGKVILNNMFSKLVSFQISPLTWICISFFQLQVIEINCFLMRSFNEAHGA